jgi:beta-glucanase (GH16 family)
VTYYNYLGQPMPESASSSVDVSGNGSDGQTLYAPAGGALIDSGAGVNNLLVGNTGDDTFIVRDASDTVQVASGLGGVDTIAAFGVSYALPANVQNLTVSGTYNYAEGNSGANLITVTNDDGMTLYGGGGNDVLVGGFGQDYFLDPANSGNDVIYNFNSKDIVRLPGTSFSNFSQVQAAMTQVGSDVKLQVDANDVLIFRNMTIGQFSASNFLYKFDPSVLGKMTFDAEFNAPPQFWNYSTNTGQWITHYAYGLDNQNSFTLTGNAESEVYVDPSFKGQGTTALGLNPFSTSNGVLTITGSMMTPAQQAAAWGQPIASGMLSTEGIFEQKYGYFEINAAFPETKGAWPAFWMNNDKGGQEADIGEARGVTPNLDYVRDYSSSTYSIVNALKSGDPSGFHTYGLLWTPTTLTYYYDGYAVMTAPTPTTWTDPMYMIANLAFGGWGGKWDPSSLPASMQIDWVRAYALADGSSQVINGTPPPLANENMPPPTTGGGSGSGSGSGSTPPPPPPPPPPGGAIQAAGSATALAGSAHYTDAELLSNGSIALTAASPLGGGAANGVAHEYDHGTGAQIGGTIALQGFASSGMTMDPVISALSGGYWEVTYAGTNAPANVEIYDQSGHLVSSSPSLTFTPMNGGGFVAEAPSWNGQFAFITASGAWDWIQEQTVNGAKVAPSGVTALSNGGFADWYQGSSVIDVYGANGAHTAAVHLGAPAAGFAMNLAALPNGDFAAAWVTQTSSGGWELELQTFNASGGAITAATNVVADADPWHTQIKLIPTGQPDQAVLLWSQGGAIWGVTATGSTVGTATPIIAGSLNQVTETTLSNGNIVLTWLQHDNGVQDLWAEVVSPSTLRGTAVELGQADGQVHVVATADGGFAASWHLGSQIEARGYDGHGDYGAVASVSGDFLGFDATTGQIVAVGPDGHGGAVLQHYTLT